METSGSTLELCMDIHQAVDQAVTSQYKDWLAKVKSIKTLVILYGMIYFLTVLVYLIALISRSSWTTVLNPYNLMAATVSVLLTFGFFKGVKPLNRVNTVAPFIFRVIALKVFLLFEMILICSIFVSNNVFAIQNINYALTYTILASVISAFFAGIIAILFNLLIRRIFFVIAIDIASLNSEMIPSFETIQVQLLDRLKHTFDVYPLSRLKNALELLHQRRESRIQHATILSFAVTVIALIGIVMSMGTTVFTTGDKFFWFFSLTNQSTSGMSMAISIVTLIALIVAGSIISARIYYGAFLSSSTQIVLRAYLQDRQIEEAKKDAAFLEHSLNVSNPS